MPAKSVRTHTYSADEISALKDQMGITSMAESLSTLTGLMQTFAKESSNNSNKKTRCETVSQPVTQSRENVPSQRQLISLEPHLDSSNVNDEFNMDEFFDNPIQPSGTVLDCSPSQPDVDTSFDPAIGFSEAFGVPSTESGVPVSEDLSGDPEFTWVIPQLQAEEKTGDKISESLAKAVNAAVTVKSNADSIKMIEEKYFRPENCGNLTVPRVNREVWSKLPKQAHTQDSKMQEVQKYLAIVQLADECCKTKGPLDPSKLRSSLSDSICLLGHGFLGLSQRRRSNLRPYFHEKFKPICNSDIPVDSQLFGTECMKHLKELGDYTKVPMCVSGPRYRYPKPGNRYGYNSGNRDHLNSRGPAFMQGNRYPPPLRGRGRGMPMNRGPPKVPGQSRNHFQR